MPRLFSLFPAVTVKTLRSIDDVSGPGRAEVKACAAVGHGLPYVRALYGYGVGVRFLVMSDGFSMSRTELCVARRCGCIQKPLGINKTQLLLCKICYEQVEAELRDLPRIYRALVHVMLPSPQHSLPRIKGIRSASGISINEDASSCRSEILSFLMSWSALVVDECSDRKPASRDCDSLALFLLRNLEWLLAHPAAGDFEAEIYELTVRTRKLAGSMSTQFDIGPCVQPGCDARLSAVQSARNGSYEIHCGAGHTWQANQWLQLYRQLRGA